MNETFEYKILYRGVPSPKHCRLAIDIPSNECLGLTYHKIVHKFVLHEGLSFMIQMAIYQCDYNNTSTTYFFTLSSWLKNRFWCPIDVGQCINDKELHKRVQRQQVLLVQWIKYKLVCALFMSCIILSLDDLSLPQKLCPIHVNMPKFVRLLYKTYIKSCIVYLVMQQHL